MLEASRGFCHGFATSTQHREDPLVRIDLARCCFVHSVGPFTPVRFSDVHIESARRAQRAPRARCAVLACDAGCARMRPRRGRRSDFHPRYGRAGRRRASPLTSPKSLLTRERHLSDTRTGFRKLRVFTTNLVALPGLKSRAGCASCATACMARTPPTSVSCTPLAHVISFTRPTSLGLGTNLREPTGAARRWHWIRGF